MLIDWLSKYTTLVVIKYSCHIIMYEDQAKNRRQHHRWFSHRWRECESENILRPCVSVYNTDDWWTEGCRSQLPITRPVQSWHAWFPWQGVKTPCSEADSCQPRYAKNDFTPENNRSYLPEIISTSSIQLSQIIDSVLYE